MGDGEHHNIFGPPPIPYYRVASDYLRDYDQTEFQNVDFTNYINRTALACVDGIVEHLGEFRREFICTYNNQHRGFADYSIYEAVDRYTLP